MLNIEDYMEEAKFAAEIAYNSTILEMGLYNSLDEEYLLVEGVGDKIKEIFGKFKEWVKKAFNKVIEFFKNIIGKIKQKLSKKNSTKSSAKKKGEQKKKKEEPKKKVIRDYSEALRIVKDISIENAGSITSKYVDSIKDIVNRLKERADRYTEREDDGYTLPYGKKHDDDGEDYIDYAKKDSKYNREDLKNAISESIPGNSKDEKILNILKSCYKGSSTIFTSTNANNITNNIISHVKTIETENPDKSFVEKQKDILYDFFNVASSISSYYQGKDNRSRNADLFIQDIIAGLEESRNNVCRWAENYGRGFIPNNKKENSDAHKFFVALQNDVTESINSVVFTYKLFGNAFSILHKVQRRLVSWSLSMAEKDGVSLNYGNDLEDDDFFDD